jgi:hypothetical protein
MIADPSEEDDSQYSPDPTAADAPKAKSKPKQKKGKRKPRAATAAKRRERNRELARELAMELTTLRSSLAEIVERFYVRVGGQYAELLGRLDPGAVELNAPPAEVSQIMIDRIRKTALKPRKARAKDLFRLEELAHELEEMLPSTSADK